MVVQRGQKSGSCEVAHDALRGGDGATVRAAVYVRISKDRASAGLGVTRQEEDCAALCRRRRWQIVRVYVDNDVSAYSGKPHPAWKELLANIRAGRIDAIVCWHVDRLTCWTHMYALGHFKSDGTWHDYDNLQCYYNNSGGNWLFDKISNTELQVDQGVGSAC